jgi:ABC-type dipeptide/oligopeptide/nickel transport system ATPase subunit
VAEPLLEIDDLSVAFDTEHGRVWAVDAVDLKLDESGTLGIVGESGSGKSVTALSIVRRWSLPLDGSLAAPFDSVARTCSRSRSDGWAGFAGTRSASYSRTRCWHSTP